MKSTWAAIASTAQSKPAQEEIRSILKQTMAEIEKEQSDKGIRESNLILYHVKECESADPEERTKEDTKFFDKLCTEIL